MTALVSLTFFLLGLFLSTLVSILLKKDEPLKKKVRNVPERIVILIPARNESKVIESLLISIENQSSSILKDVYVIVEDEHDKTVDIVKKHHMNYFVRQNLELKTKGYALQEMIEYLHHQNKTYDMYFIFDADNILDKDYLKYMIADYLNGYDISTGYRALKNTKSYFPICAGLTFTFINGFRNQKGSKILSGTGYYISGEYIQKWQTFPFHSLTEDYESSLYYTLENISVHYNEKAKFYDEQPEDYQKSIKQRSRWIKGYFQNYFYYHKLLKAKLKENPSNKGEITQMYLGIIPYLCYLFGFVFLIIYLTGFKSIIFLPLLLYFIFFLCTIYNLYLFQKETKLSKKLYFQVLFYHPIFMFSYLHAFLRCLIHPSLGWEEIKHEKNKE